MAIFSATNSNDAGEGSLREAISQANANPGTDTVFVGADVNLESQIEITDSLYLGTPYGATVTQTGSDRVFTIDDGDSENNINVSFHRLNLTGGKDVEYGGAIYSSENLTLHHTEISGNSALHRGGGVYHTTGKLAVIDSTINESQIMSGDPLISWGGGIYLDNAEKFDMAGSSVSFNDSIIGSAIAIRNTDSDISNSIIENNFDAGGIIDISDSMLNMSFVSLRGNAQSSSYNIFNNRESQFNFEEVIIDTGFDYELA